MTTHWNPASLVDLVIPPESRVEAFDADSIHMISNARWYWDQCPICDETGSPLRIGPTELWITLSAARVEPPEARHDNVRLRLLTHTDGQWRDWGNLLPDGFSPGSCEWAGMAYVSDTDVCTVYYTVKGTADEAEPSYSQRIFAARAQLSMIPRIDTAIAEPVLDDWVDLGEQIRADGRWYQPATETTGQMGGIKAFRDPFWMRDASSGKEYLLFAASAVGAATHKNAAIGMASRASPEQPWALHPPLLIADGVTNEMERPHLVRRDSLYYLFWSAHGWTFDARLSAPTALYGMVSDSMNGPFKPLNGSGLVAANPADSPFQAYSWMVCADLRVCSFVDLPDGVIDPSPSAPAYPQGHFQGGFAPTFELKLDGARASICLPVYA